MSSTCALSTGVESTSAFTAALWRLFSGGGGGGLRKRGNEDKREWNFGAFSSTAVLKGREWLRGPRSQPHGPFSLWIMEAFLWFLTPLLHAGSRQPSAHHSQQTRSNTLSRYTIEIPLFPGQVPRYTWAWQELSRQRRVTLERKSLVGWSVQHVGPDISDTVEWLGGKDWGSRSAFSLLLWKVSTIILYRRWFTDLVSCATNRLMFAVQRMTHNVFVILACVCFDGSGASDFISIHSCVIGLVS